MNTTTNIYMCIPLQKCRDDEYRFAECTVVKNLQTKQEKTIVKHGAKKIRYITT